VQPFAALWDCGDQWDAEQIYDEIGMAPTKLEARKRTVSSVPSECFPPIAEISSW